MLFLKTVDLSLLFWQINKKSTILQNKKLFMTREILLVIFKIINSGRSGPYIFMALFPYFDALCYIKIKFIYSVHSYRHVLDSNSDSFVSSFFPFLFTPHFVYKSVKILVLDSWKNSVYRVIITFATSMLGNYHSKLGNLCLAMSYFNKECSKIGKSSAFLKVKKNPFEVPFSIHFGSFSSWF